MKIWHRKRKPESDVCGHVGPIVVTNGKRDPEYSCVKPKGHWKNYEGDDLHQDKYGNTWTHGS